MSEPRIEAAPPAQPAVPRHELSRATRNGLKLALSLTSTWTVALLVRFLVPRHLGPERFGALNFAEAFSAGFFVLLNLGIDTYSMREVAVRPAHATDYFGGILALRGLLTAAVFGVMLGILFAQGRPADLVITVCVYGATHALTSINGTLAVFLQASGRIDRLAVVNVAGKLVWGGALAGVLLGGAFGSALWALAAPLLLSEVLKAAVLFDAARRAVDLRLRFDAGMTRTVLIAGLPFFLSVIAVSVGGRLNFLVLDAVSTDKLEVGYYAGALNLAMLAMLFSPVFDWILMPIMSRARVRSLDEVHLIVRRSLEGFLVLVTPVVLIVALGADLWVRLALGASYAAAANALRGVSAMVFFTYAAILLNMALVVVGRSWSVSFLSLLSVALAPALAALFVPALRGMGPGGEALGAAASAALAEVFVVGIALVRLGKGIVDRRLVTAALKSLLAAALVVLLDRLLTGLGNARLLIDALAWCVLSLALGTVRIGELREVISLVRDTRRERTARVEPA